MFNFTLSTNEGSEVTHSDFIDYPHTIETYLNLIPDYGLRLTKVREIYVPSNPILGGDVSTPGYFLIMGTKD
jgi:hypothetical protein